MEVPNPIFSPVFSFSPLNQTSKISPFWLTFHSESAVQDGQGPHAGGMATVLQRGDDADQETPAQRTFSEFDGCFPSSRLCSAIPLTRCFFHKQNRISGKGQLFPTGHDYGCAVAALSPGYPQARWKHTAVSVLQNARLHTVAFINLHSHTTAILIMNIILVKDYFYKN